MNDGIGKKKRLGIGKERGGNEEHDEDEALMVKEKKRGVCRRVWEKGKKKED